MSKEIQTTPPQASEAMTVKNLFNRDDVKKRFQEMLGNRSNQFITSVLQIAASSDQLKNADPSSIYNAAAVAATLDLPLNQNLGFAYIVAYNQKQKDGSYKMTAQFQMGYKGFIQLAQRSGQFKTISATPIYEGQLIEENPLTGFVFDFTKKTSDKIIGYASYFELLNGFQKTLYMTVGELTAHGKKFSQTFKKGFGLWKDDFDSMCTKTVIKLLLSKFAPLSIEMQKATIVDQGILTDETGDTVVYADHEEVKIDKEAERLLQFIEASETMDQLELVRGECSTPELTIAFQNKLEMLFNADVK